MGVIIDFCLLRPALSHGNPVNIQSIVKDYDLLAINPIFSNLPVVEGNGAPLLPMITASAQVLLEIH